MKRTRLLLISLGQRTFSHPFCTPPMGVLYLAAYVRARCKRVDVEIIDQRVLNLPVEDVLQRIKSAAPDIVGYSTLTSFAHMLAPLTESVRALAPRTLQIVGGPHASAFQAATLDSCSADAVVVGEGERTLEQVIQAHESGSGFAGIPGLIWRDERGETVVNPGAAPQVEVLDDLPMPAYDLIDLPLYWKVPPMGPLPIRKYLSFFTSRGCPYQCIYCHSIFGRRFRQHSAERVVEEIACLTKKYGVREIEFLDDMFNCNAQRVLDICNLAIEQNLKLRINLPNSIRTDILTEEVMDAMIAAGLYHASFALETGSPRIQKLIKKNLDIPRFLRNVEYAVRKGVFAHGFNMMGFPTETEEEVRATIDTACGSAFHTAAFFTVTPYPATELYRLTMETHPERLEGLNYENKDYSLIRLNLSEVSDDVFYNLQRLAWRRFFLNPRRILRIARDYPQRSYLLYYLPKLLPRQLKGIMPSGS